MDVNTIISLPDRLIRTGNGIIKSVQENLLGKVDRTKLTSRLLPAYQYGRELYADENYGSLIEAYKEWVYICASRNATTAASVPLRLYVAKKTAGAKLLRPTRKVSVENKQRLMKRAGLQSILIKSVDIEELADHNFITLLKNVNHFMNRFMLWELTHINLDLTGNAYWWLPKNSQGIPAEIWLMPPEHTYIVPSKENFIDGYLYKGGMMGKAAFTTDEIIHFKYANPHSPYYGLGRVAAFLDSYNIYQNMNRYEKAIFNNMGRPDGILETEQTGLPDETYKKIHDEWEETYGGSNNAGKIAILEAGTTYKPLNYPPRELAFLQGRQLTKDVIRSAFGQTNAMYEASSLASAEIADRSYLRDTIVPMLTRIEEKLNEQLTPMYNDMTLFVAFDNPIPENREEIRLDQKHRLENGLSDIDEERKRMGEEPYNIPNTNIPMINQGRVPVSMAGLLGGGYNIPNVPPEKMIDELSDSIASKMLEV